MKKSVAYVFAGIGALVMAGCSSEQPEPQQRTGAIMLHLSEPDVVVEATRALPNALITPTAAQCSLRVEENGTVYYGGPYRDFIMVPYGHFTVTATYGDNPVLAKDSPYYEGTVEDASGNPVTVTVSESAPEPSVAITCRVANALASVVWRDHDGNVSATCFDEQFLPGYYVEAKVGETVENIVPGEHVYFRAGTVPTFTFKGIRRYDNTPVSLPIEASSVPARTHLILNLTVSAGGDAILVTSAETADNSTPLVRPQI